MAQPKVRLKQVEKRYGDTVILSALDLDLMDGEFLTLLGPSGCGKTTTLRMIAGFVDPSAGQILLDGSDITRLPPNKRDVGMVFQNYALFPHLTVSDNISFGMKQRRATESERRTRVHELLELVKLQGAEHKYPAQLSGGQRQRVAIARAVAHPPRILLMDEPLGALDLKLRESMQQELRAIQQRLKITTLYVTHDQSEAMVMSDRIVVMNRGHVEQLGTAEDIYLRPATRFVADFVGRINLLAGTWSAPGSVFVGERHLLAPLPSAACTPGQPLPSAAFTPGQPVLLAVRPELVRFLAPGEESGAANVLQGTVRARLFVGNLVHLQVDVGAATLLVESPPGAALPQVGQAVRVCWLAEHSTVLPAEASQPDAHRAVNLQAGAVATAPALSAALPLAFSRPQSLGSGPASTS
jgi:spermidine/putrescine ABC transporter ATP-binding subunit